MWLTDVKRKGLTFYVSKETIGKIDMGESSWFTGFDEKMYYGKGAFYQAIHPNTIWLWMLYFALRTCNVGDLNTVEKIKWMRLGRQGYAKMPPFGDYQEQ